MDCRHAQTTLYRRFCTPSSFMRKHLILHMYSGPHQRRYSGATQSLLCMQLYGGRFREAAASTPSKRLVPVLRKPSLTTTTINTELTLMDHGDHSGHGGMDMSPKCTMNMLW